MTLPAEPRRPRRVGPAPAGVVVLLVVVLLASGTAGLAVDRRRAAERGTQDQLAERARAGPSTLSPLAVTDRLVIRRPNLVLDVRSRRDSAANRTREAWALRTGRTRRPAPMPAPAEGGSGPAQAHVGGLAAEPSAAAGLLPGILAGLVTFILMAAGWRWFERRHRPVRDALSLLARDDEQAWHTVVDRLSKGDQPPKEPAAQFALAYARARLGRLTEASAVLAATPTASQDPAALHLDLWLKLEQQQFEEATTLWERAASEKLMDHEESCRLASLAYLALARQSLADGDIAQALHRFDQVRDLRVLNERVPDTAARYWTLHGMDKLLDQDPRAAREAFRRADAATADADPEGTLLARLGVLLCDWRATEGASTDDLDRRLGAMVEAVRADQGLFPADRQRLLRDLALWQTVARVAAWKRRTVPGRGLAPQELEDLRAAVAEVRSHDPTMPDPDLIEGLILYFLADPGDGPARERALRQIRRAADGGVTLQEVLDLLEEPAGAADGVDEYLSLLGGYLQDSRVPPTTRWRVRRHLGRFGRVQRLLETDLRGGDQELAPSVADLKARGELLQERVGSLLLPELSTVDPDQARQVHEQLRRLERSLVLLSRAIDRVTQLEEQLVVLTGELLLADEPAGRS
jgi:tetratricopeptide (TPR) repeat protein